MTTKYEPVNNAQLFVVVRDSTGTDYGMHFDILNPRIVLEYSDQSLAHLNVDGYVANQEIVSLDVLDKMLDK